MEPSISSSVSALYKLSLERPPFFNVLDNADEAPFLKSVGRGKRERRRISMRESGSKRKRARESFSN